MKVKIPVLCPVKYVLMSPLLADLHTLTKKFRSYEMDKVRSSGTFIPGDFSRVKRP